MTREIEEHEQTGSVLGAILCFDTCCLRFYLRIFLLRMWRFSSDLHLEKGRIASIAPQILSANYPAYDATEGCENCYMTAYDVSKELRMKICQRQETSPIFRALMWMQHQRNSSK